MGHLILVRRGNPPLAKYLLLITLILLAWSLLNPCHRMPWTTFYQEHAAAMALLVGVFSVMVSAAMAIYQWLDLLCLGTLIIDVKQVGPVNANQEFRRQAQLQRHIGAALLLCIGNESHRQIHRLYMFGQTARGNITHGRM
jgi:hypothetical protein